MKYLTISFLMCLIFLPMRMSADVVETVEGIPVVYSFDNGTRTAFVDGLRTYKLVPNDDGGSTMVQVDLSGTITIPKELQFKTGVWTVVKIQDNAFSGMSLLTEIRLPETIVQIGKKAFFQCTSLQTINIPDAVSSIGSEAFSGCSSLQEISIPNSVTKIEYYTFKNCSSLTNVDLSDGLTQIDDEAFGGCMSLNNVILPNTLTWLAYNAFKDCSSLYSIEIPQGISQIECATFSGCSSLTNVVANGVEQIDNNAFEGCRALSNFAAPNVKGIGEYAFSDCTSLAEINFPSGLSTIGKNAFSGCTSLESIKLPDSTISLGENSFFGCTSLETIETGKGLLVIGENAFGNCNNLASVDMSRSDGFKAIRNIFDDCTSLSSISLPKYLNEIELNCQSLTSIELPTNLKKVALVNIQILNTLAIPQGVNYVSLQNGTSLENIYISEGVDTLYLDDCESLKSIDLPSTLRVFSFENCYSLESIVIPEGVTTMGSLWRCSSLKSITLPSTMKSFGTGGPFTGCTAVTDLYCRMNEPINVTTNPFEYFPSNVILHVPYTKSSNYLNSNVWYMWKRNLASVVEDDVRTGDDFTVSFPIENENDVAVKCIVTNTNTLEIAFGNNSAEIASAFDEGVSGEMIIPKTVTDPYGLVFKVTGLEKGAFYGTNVTSVVLHNGITNIRENAFANCQQLNSIFIPKETKLIEKAFTGCNNLQSVFVNWRKPEDVDVSSDNFENMPVNAVLYVPAGTKERYSKHEVWGKFSQIIESGPISLGDISAKYGSKAELPVILKNEQNIAAVQFKLTLPDGVSVRMNESQLCTSTTSRTNKMTIMGNKDPESANSYFFVLLSMNGDYITAGDGAIMNIGLYIDNIVSLGDYEIKIEDVYMTSASFDTLNPMGSIAELSVTDIMLGDVNADGIVNITDAIGVVNYILKNTPTVFIEGAADVNNDGIINVTDAIGIVNMILNKEASAPARVMETFEVEPQ